MTPKDVNTYTVSHGSDENFVTCGKEKDVADELVVIAMTEEERKRGGKSKRETINTLVNESINRRQAERIRLAAVSVYFCLKQSVERNILGINRDWILFEERK